MTIDDIRRLRTIIKTTTAPLEYVVCMYGNLRDGQYKKVNENYITFVTDTYELHILLHRILIRRFAVGRRIQFYHILHNEENKDDEIFFISDGIQYTVPFDIFDDGQIGTIVFEHTIKGHT